MDGAKELEVKFLMAAHKLGSQLAAALYMEAELVKADSMKRTPVDTGVLRASHEVDKPQIGSDGEISVSIGVGGPSIGYAIYVHEVTWVHHPVGEAKFLQHAVEAAAAGLGERVAKRVNWAEAFK